MPTGRSGKPIPTIKAVARARRRLVRRVLAAGRASALYLGLALLLACVLASNAAPTLLHLFVSK